MTSPARSSTFYVTALVVLLIAANVGTFLWLVALGMPAASPRTADLIRWGGNYAPFTFNGEAWRLLSSCFVHGGPVHLAANMLMLWGVGRVAGLRYGAVGLALIFLAGGAAASLASAWWASTLAYGGEHRSLTVSVGASGAIMAVCGALVADWLSGLLRREVPAEHAAFHKQLLGAIGVNVVLGFVLSFVDQAAHLGGLAAGLVLGAGMGPWHAQRHGMLRWARLFIAPALLLAGVAWGLDAANTPQMRAKAEAVRGRAAERQALKDEALREEAAAADEKSQAERAEQQIEQEAANEKAAVPPPVSDELARGKVLDVGKGTSAFVLSDDEQRLYLLNHRLNEFKVLELADGAVSMRVSGREGRPLGDCVKTFYCRSHGASAMATLPESGLVLVSSMEPDAVSVIDLKTQRIMKTIKVGRFPRDILVAPDRRHAYVHNVDSQTVSVIDLQTWKVLATVRLQGTESGSASSDPARPLSMWWGPDKRTLIVMGWLQKTYDQIASGALKKLRPLTVEEGNPHRVVPDVDPDGALLALMSEGVALLHPYTMEPLVKRKFCRAPWVRWVTPEYSAFDAVRDAQGRTVVASTGPNEGFVQVARYMHGVTLGTFPLADDSFAWQIKFAKGAERLFVLASNGKLSIFQVNQRMKVDKDADLFCGDPER